MVCSAAEYALPVDVRRDDGPPRLFLVRETTPEYGEDADVRGGPPPNPLSDADALEELEEEITTLAAHIHAATHRLLELLAEFDRRRGWELGGHRSCAHWLHFRTGIDLGAAREKVRAARALESLPETSASMARGELSFSKVRALTRVATPETESDLLALARGCTTAQLERVIRALRPGSEKDEEALERERHQRRCLSVFPDHDGMYVVRGRLTAEVGALLMRAMEAACDSLYREEAMKRENRPGTGVREEDVSAETPGGVGPGGRELALERGPAPSSHADAARRRADALALLAERALDAGFENGPVSGSRAARHQVVLHVEPETLKSEDPISRFKRELLEWDPDVRTCMGEGVASHREPALRSHLDDGTRVSAETSRRVSCDCSVVPVHHHQDGSILNVGRKTRSIPPVLRRALEFRDRGCRFPGCGHRFTDAHHVKHWADGGETSLENTLLLCAHHHRLVHEGGWTVRWWGKGRPVFMDPRGRVHFEGRWEPPEGRASALMAQNRSRGIDPDGYTASARWKREMDIPGEVLWPAEEALLPGPG